MDAINISLILAQLLNFCILFWLFARFIATPLMQTIEARRQLQKRLDAAAADYEENLAKARKQREDILQQARDQAKAMMGEMQDIARQKSDDILIEAQKKAEAELEGARRQLEKERLSMLANMKSKVIDLSLKLNQKLFENAKIDRSFLQQEMGRIEIS